MVSVCANKHWRGLFHSSSARKYVFLLKLCSDSPRRNRCIENINKGLNKYFINKYFKHDIFKNMNIQPQEDQNI